MISEVFSNLTDSVTPASPPALGSGSPGTGVLTVEPGWNRRVWGGVLAISVWWARDRRERWLR